MSPIARARTFDFCLLEDRILLSGDGLEGDGPVGDVDADLLDAFAGRLAVGEIPDPIDDADSPSESGSGELVVTDTTDGGLRINESGHHGYLVSDSGLDDSLDEFTFEMRFRADWVFGRHVFFSYNVDGEDQLSLRLDSNGSDLVIDIGTGGSLVSDAIDYHSALVDGDEHTLSLSWENTTGTWRVFIDGSVVDQGAGYQVGNQVDADGTFVFAKEQDGEDGPFAPFLHFRGLFTEARLYNDVRSDLEIADNWTRDVTLGDANLINRWSFNSVDIDGNITDDVAGVTLRPNNIFGGVIFGVTSELYLGINDERPDDSIVGTIRVTVPGDFTFQIVNQSEPGAFRIDPDTGTVILNDSSLIDADVDPVEQITVRATHSDGSWCEETFDVLIVDDNGGGGVSNRPPVIDSDGGGDQVDIIVDENNQFVTDVHAVDPDVPAQPIVYSIVGGSDASLFSIDPNTGRLIFISPPDAENHSDSNGDGEYEVVVQASDGQAIDAQTIRVTVNDVNEFDISNLVDSDTSGNSVGESLPPGSNVGITAFAYDQDATQSGITYTLIDNDGGRFSIDPITGQVVTATSLDYLSEGPTRTIVIRATSQDGSFVDQSFDIQIESSNTNPVSRPDWFLTTAGRTSVTFHNGVLGNDFDADGHSLTSSLVTNASHGRIVMDSDGSFVYYPDPGFVGFDHFYYVAHDGIADSNPSIVLIRVLGPNGPGNPGTPLDPGDGGGDGSGNGNSGSGNNNPNDGGNGDGQIDSESNEDSGDNDNNGDGGTLGDPGGDSPFNDSESKLESRYDSDQSTQDSFSEDARQDSLTDSGANQRSDSENTDPSGAHPNQNSPGGDSSVDAEHNAFVELVYQNLFASETNEAIQYAESSQEIRQLERVLESDLKQAILWDMWDDHQLMLEESTSTAYIGLAGGAAGLFSIGYAMWVLRGGAFISVLISCVPSWQLVDPTALLTAYRSARGESGEDLGEIVR